MPRLVAISDTHNQHKKMLPIPDGDILIHAGDFTVMGRHTNTRKFLQWFASQPHPWKILVAGNHDISFHTEPKFKLDALEQHYLDDNHFYLENEGIRLLDVMFWGSPWTPEFGNWAFGYNREHDKATRLWNLIPRNTDVVITHGPPKNILDKCAYNSPPYPQNAGCAILRHRLEEIKPKYHLFGHIHEMRGCDAYTLSPTVCINITNADLAYTMKHKPVVLDLNHNGTSEIVDF